MGACTAAGGSDHMSGDHVWAAATVLAAAVETGLEAKMPQCKHDIPRGGYSWHEEGWGAPRAGRHEGWMQVDRQADGRVRHTRITEGATDDCRRPAI